jgi:hypothetical protein
MPQTKQRKGQVLRWDDVHAQFADAARTTPIETVDRDLAAMGYDLDRLRAGLGTLAARSAEASPAGVRSEVTAGSPRSAPEASRSPPAARDAGRSASAHRTRGWRGKAMAAGALAAMLVAVFVLPASQTVVARWFAPLNGKVELASRPASLDAEVQALIQSTLFASDPLGFAINLNSAGQMLEAADRNGAAEQFYGNALAIFRTFDRKDDPHVATVASNLARLLLARNWLDDAEELMWHALTIDLRYFGPNHPNIAGHLKSLRLLQQARRDKPSKAYHL